MQTNRPRVGLGVVIYDKHNNTILLSKRKDNNLYGLPGGHLELYESFQDCAQREVQEETLLNIELGQMKFMSVYNVISQEINYHYVVIYMACVRPDNQKAQNPESHKHDDWVWLSGEQLDKLERDQLLFHSLKDAFQQAGGVTKFLQNVHDLLQ